MKEIRDCKRRIVCKADNITGLVVSHYRDCTVETQLSAGEKIVFERQGVITEVVYTSSDFQVYSN